MGPQHSWGLLQPFPASMVAKALVLRIGLDSQEVGSAAVGTMAVVFVKGPGLFSGLSSMDGIGYIGKHQPAGPLQRALGREHALALCGLQGGSSLNRGCISPMFQ